MRHSWLPFIVLALTGVFGKASATPLDDALGKCLIGRNALGETSSDRLPPYNLGRGFTCDRARAEAFAICRIQGHDAVTCTRTGDAERSRCEGNVCRYVYSQCLVDRCTIVTNDFECWREGQFGYFGYRDGRGERIFQPLPGFQAAPPDRWQAVCNGRHIRCQDSMNARPGDRTTPITPRFPSAAVYGHNCHHAASDVGKCLVKEGVKDVQVVVFDDGPARELAEPGNLSHSVLSVPHTDGRRRCLVESQKKPASGTSAIDDRCCYATDAERAELVKKGCPVVFWGPLREPFDVSRPRVYSDPATFLRDRGTGAAE